MKKRIKYKFQKIKRRLIDGYLLRGYRRDLPRTIIVEPTNICHLSCPICPNSNKNADSRTKGIMKSDTFQTILSNVDYPLQSIFFYLHGEPFLNPELATMVQIASEKGIKPIVVSNGYNISLEILSDLLEISKVEISFSMDLIDKKHYEYLRYPASFEQAISHLKKMDDCFKKKGKKYELKIVLQEKNTGELIAFLNSMFGNLNSIKKISIGNLFPWPEDYILNTLENHLYSTEKLCNQVLSGLAVFWNGEVSLCSFDFYGKSIVGNLTKSPLSSIFNSLEARSFRKKHFIGQYRDIPLCKNCLLPRFKSYSRDIYPKQYLTMDEDKKMLFIDSISSTILN